jgi:hypothetical protein
MAPRDERDAQASEPARILKIGRVNQEFAESSWQAGRLSQSPAAAIGD